LRKEEIAKQEELLNKAEKKLLKKQFSAYDGLHRGLEKYIKNNMNDPDSYEH
jgi:hypothetical protein